MNNMKQFLKNIKCLKMLYSKYLDLKASIIYIYNNRIKDNRIQVYSIEETLDKIINDQCSIVRFGDGEMFLIEGKDIPFQKYDRELSEKLISVLKSTEEKLLVCIPDIFDNLNIYNKKAQKSWKKNLLYSRKRWEGICQGKKYYNAFMSRLYIDLKDKNKSRMHFDKFFQLYKNRDVILVEGEFSRLGCGNNLFDNVNSLKRILCPTKHAYLRYNDILSEVLKQDKDKLILLSLGPTAKVLAYDLYKCGYQVLDIGHIDLEYEWFLKGVTEKVKIDNKFVNEVDNGEDNISNTVDEKYEKEIIAKII